MDQGEPGVDYVDENLNPLICDICKKTFDSLDKLGEHQKQEHDMWINSKQRFYSNERDRFLCSTYSTIYEYQTLYM